MNFDDKPPLHERIGHWALVVMVWSIAILLLEVVFVSTSIICAALADGLK